MDWSRGWDKGVKALALLSNRTYRRALRRGVAAGVEHARLLKALAPATLIDIGANVGQFSLAAKTIHPDLVIHAFEPLTQARRVYESLFSGRPEVHLHACAAGEAAAQAELRVSARPDSSSLLDITARQETAFPGTGQARSETVAVRRVDEVLAEAPLPAPVLAKLDVQGFELSAIKGMSGLLDRIDFIYVETSFVELYRDQPLAAEVIRWLDGQGFELDRVEMVARDSSGAVVQGDFLFRRARRTPQ